MEIILGLIIAIIWHNSANRDKHYENQDWEKIKDDRLK